MRLDIELFNRNLFESRQKAKYAIENKRVLVNNALITKASFDVSSEDKIEIIQIDDEFVSRAGNKLLKAINEFSLDFTDKIMLDIGASTGGFTDCALQHGAKYVYALDVGTNQLHPKIRADKRVKCIEQTNFRYCKKEDLDNTMFDIVSIDVSFISLEIILDNLSQFLKEDGYVVALIKPQFELYEESNKNKGLITKKDDHIKAIDKVIKHAISLGFYPENLTFSPILGEKKENIEYLVLLSKVNKNINISIENVVNKSHLVLK